MRALFDEKVTAHVPLDVPGAAHVLVNIVWLAPPASVKTTVTGVLSGAATRPRPLPRSTNTVTWKVCSAPTSFTAFGVIEMDASTNLLTASGEFGDTPFVDRVSETPRTSSITDAWPVTSPASFDVKTIVHWPNASRLSPASSHVLAAALSEEDAPFESVRVKLTWPTGAGTKPAPSPEFALTVTVNVCGVPTSFAADGPIAMDASTNTLVASPEFGAMPLVSTWTEFPAMMTSAEAWPVTTPAEGDVNVTVQVPPTVPGDAQLSVMGVTDAPFDAVRPTVTMVPSGAGVCVPPDVWLTVTVQGCGSLIAFTPFGAIWMLAEQIGNAFGPAKSFSSAVKDWELRVLPMIVVLQGVSENSADASNPNSVKEFFVKLVITEP